MKKVTAGVLTSFIAFSTISVIHFDDAHVKNRSHIAVSAHALEGKYTEGPANASDVVETIDETGQVIHTEVVTDTIEYL